MEAPKMPKQHDAPEAVNENPVLAIMHTNLADLTNVLLANLGPRGLSTRDLDRIVVPAGGGLLWKLPTPDGEQLVASFRGIVLKAQRTGLLQ
jgi:hypothetical protein